MPGALNVVFGQLQRVDEFDSGKWCQPQRMNQLRGFDLIAQHAEQVDHNVIKVVVDLSVDPLFSNEHGSRAAEGFDVDSMLREILNHPRVQLPLPTMPAKDGTGRGVHARLSA